MENFNETLKQIQSVVIFKNIVYSPVFDSFKDLLISISTNSKKIIEKYSKFISELYQYTDNFTKHILDLMLEDDNIYVRKKSENLQISDYLEDCLANELKIFQEISQINCDQIIAKIPYKGFLPKYRIEKINFSLEYTNRILSISKFGYGIYSKYHTFLVDNGKIKPVKFPDNIKLSNLHDYESERNQVIANTKALLSGKPANNVLLYGDCGTGKSSTVKAIANEYAKNGLRLIELKKKQLHEMPAIVELIGRNPLKFIIFIDDLSFTEDDDDFAALKAILEGSVSSTASNLCIYATSNRRHLVKETFSARKGDEIHFKDTMQELLSLSDRFGLTITFQKPDKETYLDVVVKLAKQYNLKTPDEILIQKAEVFALSRGGRSPRTAKQFVEYVKGCEE